MAAVEAMPVGVSWASLADQTILFMNAKFTEIFGYRLGDFTDIQDWRARAYPFAEDRELSAKSWGAHFAALTTSRRAVEPAEIRVLAKDGTIKTVLSSGVLLPETGWALATFVDISDRKNHELQIRAAQRQAAENEAIYRLLLDHSREMIVLSPFDRSRRYVSSAVKQITGFTQEEYLSLDPLETFHPEDRLMAERVYAELKAGNLEHVLRYRMPHKDGSYGWVESKVMGYADPDSKQTTGYVATVRDIAEQVEREEQLANENRTLTEAADLDELTRIPNRRAFNRAIAEEVRRHAQSARDLSLLILDIDYFKRYNDMYGHLAGDGCLRVVAQTIQNGVRRNADLAARFGGEEFVVLMPTTELAGAERVARKLLKAIAALRIPHPQSPHEVVTVSVGISSWPAGEPLNSDLLVLRADQALYRAKEQGRNACEIG